MRAGKRAESVMGERECYDFVTEMLRFCYEGMLRDGKVGARCASFPFLYKKKEPISRFNLSSQKQPIHWFLRANRNSHHGYPQSFLLGIRLLRHQ